MKNQHILQLSTLLIGTVLFLTGCSFFKSSHSLNTDSPINELVPNTEVTLETKIESAADMCSFLKTSYAKMQELAAAQDASPDGVNAAKAVEEQYGDRLNELFALDFSTMDETQIDSYLVEMTDLITVIRETRDALTFN